MLTRVRRLPDDDDGCAWWSMLRPPPPARVLIGEERADCVVLGAGFTGLAIARRLATHRPDRRVVVLEAQRVGFGASGRGAGIIGGPGASRPGLGVTGNRLLARLGEEGVEQLGDLVRCHGIGCSWEEIDHLRRARDERATGRPHPHDRGCAESSSQGEWLDGAGVRSATGATGWHGAVRSTAAVMADPVALVRGLAACLPEGVDLFEESPVHRIEHDKPFRLETRSGAVTADSLFVAANGFTPSLGFARRRVFPRLTLASLTRPLEGRERDLPGAGRRWALVTDEMTLCLTHARRILVRAGAGVSAHLRLAGPQRQAVARDHRRILRRMFPTLPELELEFTWGGVLGMTWGGAPLFGRLSAGLYAAGAYNGRGVAAGTTAGALLADLAVGAPSELLRDLESLPRPGWIPPGISRLAAALRWARSGGAG